MNSEVRADDTGDHAMTREQGQALRHQGAEQLREPMAHLRHVFRLKNAGGTPWKAHPN